MKVISLYDYTADAVRPWADAGYECHCFDIQHDTRWENNICFHQADLYDPSVLEGIVRTFRDSNVAFVFGFPPCTDLAVSGAAHFSIKYEKDPFFQITASGHAKRCAVVAEALDAPWLVSLLEEAINRGVIILNVSQCMGGEVTQGKYKASEVLKKIGVVNGYDLTTEAALTKLMLLLGQGESLKSTIKQVITPISGEMTLR